MLTRGHVKRTGDNGRTYSLNKCAIQIFFLGVLGESSPAFAFRQINALIEQNALFRILERGVVLSHLFHLWIIACYLLMRDRQTDRQRRASQVTEI